MTAIVRATVLVAVVSAAVCSDGLASDPWLGACYCRAAGTLECAADLSERECRRRCDEALCDDWFWKERLPCWNWGYGG
jgi:hypothetical protein